MERKEKICYNCQSTDGYLRIGKGKEKRKLRCYICNKWKETESIIRPQTEKDFEFVTTNGCDVTNSKVVWRHKESSHLFVIYRKLINSYKTPSGAEYRKNPHFLLHYIQTLHEQELWFNSPEQEILEKFVKWIIKHRIQKPYMAPKIDIVKHFHYLKEVFKHGSYTAVANKVWPEKIRNGANIGSLSIGNACKKLGLHSKLIRKDGRLSNELEMKKNTPAYWYFYDKLDIGVK